VAGRVQCRAGLAVTTRAAPHKHVLYLAEAYILDGEQCRAGSLALHRAEGSQHGASMAYGSNSGAAAAQQRRSSSGAAAAQQRRSSGAAAAQQRRGSGAVVARRRIHSASQHQHKNPAPTAIQRSGGAARRAPSAQHEHGDPGRGRDPGRHTRVMLCCSTLREAQKCYCSTFAQPWRSFFLLRTNQDLPTAAVHRALGAHESNTIGNSLWSSAAFLIPISCNRALSHNTH
jgi:hypothetical protein